MQDITSNSGSAAVYNGNTEVTGDTALATGMTLKTGDNTYNIAVRSDANGDGKLTSVDLSKVKMHITGISELTGSNLDAIDINYDGQITTVDLSQIKLLLVGMDIQNGSVANADGSVNNTNTFNPSNIDPKLVSSDIKIIPSTTGYTGALKITVTWPEDTAGLTKEIGVEDGTGTYIPYTGDVIITMPGTVIARLADSKGNTVKVASLVITNIDDEGPLPFDFSYSHKITNYIDMSGTTTDAKSGVANYQYSLDNGKTWLPAEGESTGNYTLVTAPPDSTVDLKMRAIDKVGNATETVSVQKRTFDLRNKIAKRQIR